MYLRWQGGEVNAGIDFKSAIGRGGYIRNVIFENILFINVEGYQTFLKK